MSDDNDKPRIQLGWVGMTAGPPAAADRELAGRWRDLLARQLPEFDWRVDCVSRPLGRRQGPVDPLELLRHGVQEKVEHHWDLALVVTDAELAARQRPFIFGAPSSALETAVASRLRFATSDAPDESLLALLQFLFGSLLGLEAGSEGAMTPPSAGRPMRLNDFSPEERDELRERLADVADERLEEQHHHWNRWVFRLRTLAADFRGIGRDIAGYRPWVQPFRFGKLTAAAFVSMLLLFLGAEAWELGHAAGSGLLAAGAALAILSTSWVLYRGQNLSELARGAGLTEQVVRSEIVLGGCLFIGVVSLWVFLFAASLAIASVLPRAEIESWIEAPLDLAARARFAAFLSSLGTLAGGLGGNLEEEKAFKARFLFDEEV